MSSTKDTDMKRTMKTLLLACFAALGLSTATMAQSASSVLTNENYRAAQSVGRDVRAKKYDKAVGTALNHREVRKRTGLSDREAALLKDPRKAGRDLRKDPISFTNKHKSSFWDRFRKKSKKSSRKK
jgi:hypothetical protein